MTSLQSTAAAAERVFEFMDEKEMPDENKITKILPREQAKGNIEFDNIVFQYDNNPKPTIIGFTAKAKPGQKIAIVGPTGAGKTPAPVINEIYRLWLIYITHHGISSSILFHTIPILIISMFVN